MQRLRGSKTRRLINEAYGMNYDKENQVLAKACGELILDAIEQHHTNAVLDKAIMAVKMCKQGEFISVYAKAIEDLKVKP